MRTKRKGTPKKWDDDKLSEEQITDFMLGYSFFEDYPFEDEEHKKRLWFKHRDELMKMNFDRIGFFGSHPDRGGPGTRPEAWWRYEAPEPRRLISGEFEPHDDEMWFGAPAHWARAVDPEWESQEEYLRRLGLLTQEEIEALTKEEIS